MEKIVRTCCQSSHCECGVLVRVKDGRITEIKGDPDHPVTRGFICVKAQAQPQLIYHPDRVKYPMKRAAERGSGKWQRVSIEFEFESRAVLARRLAALNRLQERADELLDLLH